MVKAKTVRRAKAYAAQTGGGKKRKPPSRTARKHGRKNLKFWIVSVVAFLPNTIVRWLGW